MCVGLIARTVGDIKLLDTVFSQCQRQDVDIQLEGYRIGVAREWFQDIGDEARPPARDKPLHSYVGF